MNITNFNIKVGNFNYRPFYHRCDFCDVKYDVIGFMETYYDDFIYIAQKLNHTTLLTRAKERINQTPGSKQPQSRRIKEHFALLSGEARQKLYQLYRIDFEMFGFNASRYL